VLGSEVDRIGVVDSTADPRLAFEGAADIYDQARPSYPPELFAVLFAMLPPEPVVIEVGPGTGKATRDLLARGASVHAIEIAPAMAATLRSNVPDQRLRVTVGDFERVALPAASADAVVSATAYHWVSLSAQTDRPAAILRPGGLLAVIDLIQVDSPVDGGFFAAAQPIYDRYGQGHIGPPAPRRDRVDPPMRSVLEADRRFTDVRVWRVDHDQNYTAAEYRSLMLSYSGTQIMEPSEREGLLDDIEAFVVQCFGGRVTRPLVAALITGVLTA